MLYDALTPQEQQWWLPLNSTYSPDLDHFLVQERTDLTATFAQLRAAPPLGSLPAVVLASDQSIDLSSMAVLGTLPADVPKDFGATIFAAHLTGQRELAARLHATLVLDTHAGHYIQTEQPALVIEAVQQVLNRIRGLPDSTPPGATTTR
jgi:pimeloyl-ACP methyl ester carboxylesterase